MNVTAQITPGRRHVWITGPTGARIRKPLDARYRHDGLPRVARERKHHPPVAVEGQKKSRLQGILEFARKMMKRGRKV